MKRKSRPDRGRALFYSRDSGGKAEMTPSQYVTWACRESKKRGLSFDAEPRDIDTMVQTGQYQFKDLFFDYNVKGNHFDRKGLEALLAEIERDANVSHVFIPRRDRLARPDHPNQGLQLETKLLYELGVNLVFMNQEVKATARGERPEIGGLISTVIAYDNAGKERFDLAQKMIFAKIALAQGGHSIGGRAPYGFDRWLINDEGAPIRRLANGEKVRLTRHHTAWLPATDGTFEIALRIREMLTTMPASRIAAKLNAEAIPSPDAGRTRKDSGTVHAVSGLWHQPTIVNIGRNKLFAGFTTAGIRSMGDLLRFTPEGPRTLKEADYRWDEQPKVIRNAPEMHVVAQAHFEPKVTMEDHEKLTAILDARAGTQHGKPRSRDPHQNPLGGRIFDMDCTWLMYCERRPNSAALGG